MSNSTGIQLDNNSMPLFDWIYALFPSNQCVLLCKIIAFSLILIQAFLINAVSNKYSLLGFKSYIPGLIFIIITANLFQFQYLQAIIVANIFFIISWILIADIFTQPDNLKSIFNSAFFLGIASLFYPFYIYFLVFIFIAIMLNRTITLHDFGILILGFGMVWYFYLSLNYFFFDTLQLKGINIISQMNFNSIMNISSQRIMSYTVLFSILIFITLTLFHYIIISKVFIRRSLQLLFVWIFLCVIVEMLTSASVEIIYSLAIPISVLLSISLSNIKNKWIRESIWIILILLTIINQWRY